MQKNKGGVKLGGSEVGDDGDIAAARAARFEAERAKSKNRGISKESQIELKMKEKRMEDAKKF